MIKYIIFFVLTFIDALSHGQVPTAKSISGSALTRIRTTKGTIEGNRLRSGVISFKGIPYAAPPVGNLRWKPTQEAGTWKGIKKCISYGPSPMQPDPVPFSMWSKEFLIPKQPISEDCLYLNVWTGAKSVKEKRPVLVYIYGGGFVSGSGSVPIYDGEAMAKKGIIFVSFNYRLGVFGFFAHPELTKESPFKASGNYGLMDQIAALRWVKNNIKAFGGDPDNVTIAGQSAGSMSVVCLIASPLAKGLFQKAIAESGAGLLSRAPGPSKHTLSDLKQAEETGTRLGNTLNATSIKALRSLSAEELEKKALIAAEPDIDGYVLPGSVPAIFNQHKENNAALLTGWNEDDGIIFGPHKKATEFKQEIEKQYGADAKELLDFYTASDDMQAQRSELMLVRDIIFGVQNYTLANIESSHGQKVFVYRFARKVPGVGEYAKYGAFHTGEVPYAYDNLKFVNRPWENTDYQLANTMSTYWVNFIASGNPNGKGLPEWPPYKTGTKKIMELGDKAKAIIIPDSARLNFMHNLLNPDK